MMCSFSGKGRPVRECRFRTERREPTNAKRAQRRSSPRVGWGRKPRERYGRRCERADVPTAFAVRAAGAVE